jgi:hypothetical protein
VTIAELVRDLATLPGVRMGKPLAAVPSLAGGVALPGAHRQFLDAVNGAEVFDGYYRLFGLGGDVAVDLERWNAPDTWKFAWHGRPDRYWCFGETVWGDQYAYDLEELREGQTARVYFLEGVTLAAEPLADNFEHFLETDFLRNARRPYDSQSVKAHQRFAELPVTEHLAYQPSLLLGGAESLDNVVKLPALAAMIIQGDICTQMYGQLASRRVQETQLYEDDRGRMRIRVVWADAT